MHSISHTSGSNKSVPIAVATKLLPGFAFAKPEQLPPIETATQPEKLGASRHHPAADARVSANADGHQTGPGEDFVEGVAHAR